MPKLKTRKGVRKRFKITKSGKIKRKRAGKSHILTKKSRNRKRLLRQGAIVGKQFSATLKKLLPYG